MGPTIPMSFTLPSGRLGEAKEAGHAPDQSTGHGWRGPGVENPMVYPLVN